MFVPTAQQEPILAHPYTQHARVLAGPGTGKSSTLVALLHRLLSLPTPPRIKLLTFTRAATGELAATVLSHASAGAERPSTIHSFAISVLLRNPGSGGFPEPLRIADDWEHEAVILPTLKKLSGVGIEHLRKLFTQMASNWESLDSTDKDLPIPDDVRARFLGTWEEHRRTYGYTLLAELPEALRRALTQHGEELQGLDYQMLIVDEYQDLNACDLAVLRLIAQRGCSIIAAGDDDQSIYSFRNAHPDGIRRFPNEYAGATSYPLSVSQRCGKRILEWANYVIAGDPQRPKDKSLVAAAPGSPDGEVALLRFAGHAAEPRGIAQLVRHLIDDETIEPRLKASDILILLRADNNDAFSKPIKQELDALGIPYSDPDAVKQLLAEHNNRKLLELLRLLVNKEDSVAWASLLTLQGGIGEQFFDYVYQHARRTGARFANTLLELHNEDFPESPWQPASRAKGVMDGTLAWLDAHALPERRPQDGWGAWILDLANDAATPAPTEHLKTLLQELDTLDEGDSELGRYLSQVQPLGKDIAQGK